MVRCSFLIKPRVSFVLGFFFLVLYVLSLLVMFLVPVALWLHLFFSALIIFHFFYVMRRYVLYKHPLSIHRLWCDQDQWQIQCRDAHVRSATLFQSVLISRYLIFMAFRVPGRFFPIPLPLALDSENKENIRKLRVALLDQ